MTSSQTVPIHMMEYGGVDAGRARSRWRLAGAVCCADSEQYCIGVE